MHLWQTAWIRKVLEVGWFSSPWYFPEGSPVLTDVLQDFEHEVSARRESERERHACGKSGPKRSNYNWAMEKVLAAVRRHGLQLDVGAV